MENKIVFKTKTFGELEYTTTLIFYDYPRVFVCKDKNNKNYIFNEADDGTITEWWICDLAACGLKLQDLYKFNNELDCDKLKKIIYTVSYKYDEQTQTVVEESTIKKCVGNE